MKIATRCVQGLTLFLTAALMSPASATGILQCVPYARELSGVRIHGDAWTWWDQAEGRYARGYRPRAGAVIALSNTDVMPLGHVAVVSRILDDRRILLRHANWSRPGQIERDVLAIDSSPDNDWSQVRIWWGQSQQMGARDNPVDGFIYPDAISAKALYASTDDDDWTGGQEDVGSTRLASMSASPAKVQPSLTIDPTLFRTQDGMVSSGRTVRTLAMIVRDVRTDARLP